MNGKFILLVIVSLNVVSLLITAGFTSEGTTPDYELGNNYIFNTFFSTVSTQEFNETVGLDFNDATSDAIDGLDDEQASGTFFETLTSGISFILDTLKMILAFVTILTPVPILAFLSALELPLWALVLVGSPITILYVVSLAEFVGNRNL